MDDTPTVLVVEDEPSVQQTLCTALTPMGFQALHADNVDAALTILASERIDVVSLDIRIPDPKGLQRSGLSRVRSGADFTGAPLSTEDAEFLQHHEARVFYKPERYSVVIEELRRLLQKASAA